MKIPFKPLPDDEPTVDVTQFLHRLRQEPPFVEKMRGHSEAALALPLSPKTEEMHEGARKALTTLKHQQGTANGCWRSALMAQATSLRDDLRACAHFQQTQNTTSTTRHHHL